MTDSQPDDIPGNAPSNAPGSIKAQPFSVGAALREARTRLGLGVADVANRLKFAPRQIEALEADDFARLPEITFVRGFVRSYARLLQLDPLPLLDALPGAVVQPAPSAASTLAEVPFPDVYSARKPNIIWLAAALAVAAALALFAWLHGNAPSAPKAPHVATPALPAALPASAVPDTEMMKALQVAATTVQEAAEPLAQPVAASSASKQAAAIYLAFDEESWVEVKDREGKILLSLLNTPGSEQGINGKPPFSMVIGHTNGVHLYYKGQAVDLAPYTRAQVAHLTLE
ncbi:MAG: helix-turn-helix domain-containing protein [Nitrosomonadales bacterium]|nr:helix-turn-helix domain-containing protein [Nitrosomonadales bacterium]